jgi:hypothetical protein
MRNPFLPVLFFATFPFVFINAQNKIPPPSPGKSVVYFARTSGMGALINFTYCDSASLIGRFYGPAYIRYECDPGHHLFWARSENRDYVEADVAPDKVYFILADVGMGAVKASVDLIPLNPAKDTKDMERIMKLIDKQYNRTPTEEQLRADREELAPVIERGLKQYAKDEQDGYEHDVLPVDWAYVY